MRSLHRTRLKNTQYKLLVQSRLIPLAQDYARVSRDINYLPIIIKRAKRDCFMRSVCVGLLFDRQVIHMQIILGIQGQRFRWRKFRHSLIYDFLCRPSNSIIHEEKMWIILYEIYMIQWNLAKRGIRDPAPTIYSPISDIPRLVCAVKIVWKVVLSCIWVYLYSPQ